MSAMTAPSARARPSASRPCPASSGPRSDALLLAAAMRERELARDAAVLDLFTGSGVIAVAAALERRARGDRRRPLAPGGADGAAERAAQRRRRARADAARRPLRAGRRPPLRPDHRQPALPAGRRAAAAQRRRARLGGRRRRAAAGRPPLRRRARAASPGGTLLLVQLVADRRARDARRGSRAARPRRAPSRSAAAACSARSRALAPTELRALGRLPASSEEEELLVIEATAR